MPKEKKQNLSETDRGPYQNQEEQVEELLDNKGAFYSGYESDDMENDNENYNENIEQSFVMFFKISVLKNFANFTRKQLLEFLFNKVSRPKVCNLIKNRLQDKCFPIKFANFLSTPLFTEQL